MEDYTSLFKLGEIERVCAVGDFVELYGLKEKIRGVEIYLPFLNNNWGFVGVNSREDSKEIQFFHYFGEAVVYAILNPDMKRIIFRKAPVFWADEPDFYRKYISEN